MNLRELSEFILSLETEENKDYPVEIICGGYSGIGHTMGKKAIELEYYEKLGHLSLYFPDGSGMRYN